MDAPWVVLSCECGSQQFTNVRQLLWRQGGGTTARDSGFECVQCRAYVNMDLLVKAAALKQRRADLVALQAELESEYPPEPKGGAHDRREGAIDPTADAADVAGPEVPEVPVPPAPRAADRRN